MNYVWIIGNSGAARECFWIFMDMLAANSKMSSEYEFGGFLSWHNHPSNLKSLRDYEKGDAVDYNPSSRDFFVIGVGQPKLRYDIFSYMKDKNANFFTLLHPLSDINPSARIGEANVFQRSSSVYCDVCLGNANYLNGAVNLSHDVIAGDANFFGPYSLVLGECKVGSRNFLAVHTTLLPNSKIGDDNNIAPGSIVYKGCASNTRMAGNPALPIGKYGVS